MKMKGAVTAKPKLKNGKVEAPKKPKKLEKAEEAVSKYEEMRKQFVLMEEEFQKTFPQAWAKLQDIKHLEDDIRTQIDGCKILVREAGQSVGPFTFTAKFTSEGYVGSKIVELISKLPPDVAGDLFKELSDRGFIKDLVIDKAAAKVIRASDQDLREKLENAWDKGGDPLTPAISTPKF